MTSLSSPASAPRNTMQSESRSVFVVGACGWQIYQVVENKIKKNKKIKN